MYETRTIIGEFLYTLHMNVDIFMAVKKTKRNCLQSIAIT